MLDTNYTILDVFKPTTELVYYAQVKPISSTSIDADSKAGTFQNGETLTGSVSGYTY